jgi:phosphonate transport system permease protein
MTPEVRPPSQVLPPPRPWFQSGRSLLLVAALAVVYAYGWRVTKIDLSALLTGTKFVKPFVVDLVRPDVLAREVQMQEARVGVTLNAAVAPEDFPTALGSPQLMVSSRVASIGTKITVEGRNFRPSTSGVLLWRNQIGNTIQVGTFHTDAAGSFTATVTVPEIFLGPAGGTGAMQQVVAQASWATGPLRPSKTALIVGEKVVETVFLALMGTTLAVLVAVPLSFLGARNLMTKNPLGTTIYYVTRTFFNTLRSVEPLILAIVFTVWVGLGPFAGTMALALHSIAALGKLYSEQIESIDPGPIEAITATGARALQVVRYAVVPQIVPPFIAFTIYRWDTNVRMSTVIGFVGGGGVGFILQQYINLLQYRQAATAVWAITLVVAAMDFFSAKLREKVV